MPPPWTEQAADLAACRLLLRSGSRSFDAAAGLLPRSVRDPAVALYAFCRMADDAIDTGMGNGAETARPPAENLAWLRRRLALAYAGQPLALPADRAFARIITDFAIPRALPDALLEGFGWDAEGRRYADLPALRAYAVRVAGTVGAMMAVLMGVRDPERLGAAIDLGVAMQLSNIARDVGEDARAGRLYLPLQWLAEAGIDADGFLKAPTHSPRLGQVVHRLLVTAEEHYRQARPGIARLPLACRFGIAAASLLYAEIGREVARRGLDAVSSRAIVSSRRKAYVLASGIAAVSVPWRPLAATTTPEGAFLVEAIVQATRRPRIAPTPWWALREQMLWVIDLFGRIEQRERVRP